MLALVVEGSDVRSNGSADGRYHEQLAKICPNLGAAPCLLNECMVHLYRKDVNVVIEHCALQRTWCKLSLINRSGKRRREADAIHKQRVGIVHLENELIVNSLYIFKGDYFVPIVGAPTCSRAFSHRKTIPLIAWGMNTGGQANASCI